MDIKKKKNYNIDFYDKIILYESRNASQFNTMRKRLTRLGFIIKKIVLTDDGDFKLLAKIKKKPLVECLLRVKQIPENDRVYPRCTTRPEDCEFNQSGICSCVDHKFCLYQDTPEHRFVIEQMVKNYNSNNRRKYHDDCSTYYEDTSLGRIFSNDYDHLNSENIGSKYYRHHGR